MLVTVSDWGDNKGQRATHSLIKWLTFTASILSLVLLIPLNFSYDIVKIVFLIVTKSRTDKTIQCSVTAELNMQFCNEQTRAQPLFSPPCASATYGSARMSRRKNALLGDTFSRENNTHGSRFHNRDPQFASRILGAMTQSCYIGTRDIRSRVIRGLYCTCITCCWGEAFSTKSATSIAQTHHGSCSSNLCAKSRRPSQCKDVVLPI